MSGIRKNLLQLIFSGTSMKRWNDKLRPMELVEVDKQAHKMIVAWLLFQLGSRNMPTTQKLQLGSQIVEWGIFDYLYRLVITDIKPPIFYQIKANPAHYQQLTQWVLSRLRPRLQGLGQNFFDRMSDYLLEPDNENTQAGRILNAAHMYASRWEFNIIAPLNTHDTELGEIRTNFADRLDALKDLPGLEEILDIATPVGDFAHMCGQLRFQTRWSQTPRIPETSVLGHMFIVACYAYFFTLTADGCAARYQNNFFSGLFHDIPELLTRDIISPVKISVQEIGELIKEYETRELKRRILSRLENGGYKDIAKRLTYFLGVERGSEFETSIIDQGECRTVTWKQLNAKFNQDCFDPKDGELLKICDHLAAFIEAYTATRNGIVNSDLQQAQLKIKNMYLQKDLGRGLHIGTLLADFD